MSSATLMVLAVIIPASAASALVMILDLRAHRRRPPRRHPVPSRTTAVAGAALGVAGFGLTALAGVAGLGHAATAASSKVEEVWVATATGSSSLLPIAPTPGQTSTITLPWAPVEIWGTGFDGQGTYTVAAVDPSGGSPVILLSGSWPKVHGEGVRALSLVDPAAIVDAARAAGVLPAVGPLTLELLTGDPPQTVLFTLPAGPPAPAAAAPPAARFHLPGGSVAGSVRLPAGTAPSSASGSAASGAANQPAAGAPATPGVGVPATGSGAALLGGLALLVSGGACAGLSLRLRRS